MKKNVGRDHRGFSLLEVLMTVMLVGMIAVMIAPYFGSGVLTSHRPIENLQAANNLKGIMEKLNGQYIAMLPISNLQPLRNQIGSEGSDHTDPILGSYRIEKNRFICFAGGAEFNENDPQCQGPPNNSILKVTISNTNGGTLTQLFTEQEN